MKNVFSSLTPRVILSLNMISHLPIGPGQSSNIVCQTCEIDLRFDHNIARDEIVKTFAQENNEDCKLFIKICH